MRLATAALACAALLLASAAPGTAADGKEVALRFPSKALTRDKGNATTDVSVVTHGEGTVRRVDGRGGRGAAVRFPRFDSGGTDLAVLTLRDREGADDLSPGRHSFVFGADFTLDRGETDAGRDNGNNLVQRGLWNDRMQYKIQIDDRRPSCRIKGDDGGLQVALNMTVAGNTWYRVRCVRNQKGLVLRVVRLSDRRTWKRVRRGDVGAMVADPRVPMSVGGKVDAGGRIVTGAPDQFNGRVDNVILDVRD